jgi:hypothetical protein
MPWFSPPLPAPSAVIVVVVVVFLPFPANNGKHLVPKPPKYFFLVALASMIDSATDSCLGVTAPLP